MTRQRVKPEQPKWLDAGREEASERTSNADGCRIVVMGIGESGKKTVNNLVKTGVSNSNVRCVTVNTDLPTQEIESLLSDVEVVFIAAGLSGRAGTAVAPVVAELARKKDAIVVGFVSTLSKTGKRMGRKASAALKAMRRACDTIVVIDDKKLKELVPQVPSTNASKVANQVLTDMVQGIVETISEPNLVKVNLTDFRNIVRRGGVAAVGVGESDAPNRAEEAVRNALKSPLLDIDYSGATGALVHVVGDNHMTVEEVNRVGEIVTEIMGHDAQVIWGAKAKPSDDGFLKVTLMMTGVDSPKMPRGYENLMPKLYDIESSFSEPEKPLHVDLGLDQLENLAE